LNPLLPLTSYSIVVLPSPVMLADRYIGFTADLCPWSIGSRTNPISKVDLFGLVVSLSITLSVKSGVCFPLKSDLVTMLPAVSTE
ncbi:MAG: hypothetical protein ACRCXZ_06725, partial [Patescibacteria group bacterium]